MDLQDAAEFHRHEMNVETASDRTWSRWVGKVEALLAHYEVVSHLGNFTNGKLRGLDGDEAIDGFSMDGGYDAFRDGQTPARYVDNVLVKRGWLVPEVAVRGA